MNAEGLEITDEDRTRLAKHLKSVAEKLEPGERIGRVIRHLVDRRARGVEISPQRALNDVRTGKVNAAAVQSSSERVLRAFESDDDRLVKGKAYVAHEWDFTRPEAPPWYVLNKLGESDPEREKLWKRMRRIALTAMTDGEES